MFHIDLLGPAYSFALLFFLQTLSVLSGRSILGGRSRSEFESRQGVLLLVAFGAGLFAFLFDSVGASYKTSAVLYFLTSALFIAWVVKWLRFQRETLPPPAASDKQPPQAQARDS